MLETVHRRYQGSCVMLMSIDSRESSFLGTAFLVHSDGLLLTSAHILPEGRKLGIVSPMHEGPFVPLTMDHVVPVPVEVAARDDKRNIAVLKIIPDLGILVPDHIIGNAADTPEGTALMTLGFSFAHYRLHSLITLQSVLSAKVRTANGTNILLFDNRVHSGDIGGPVVNGKDERIIGIIAGMFDPADMLQDEHRTQYSLSTTISQAVSIEYGLEMIRSLGLEVL